MIQSHKSEKTNPHRCTQSKEKLLSSQKVTPILTSNKLMKTRDSIYRVENTRAQKCPEHHVIKQSVNDTSILIDITI